MAEAILAFSDINFTKKYGYKNAVTTHWILQSAAGVFILLSFFAIYVNKNNHNPPKLHFQSNHGICGLITVILTGIACVGGIFTKYSNDLKAFVKPVYSKVGHALLGSTTFLMAIITIILGFYTGWFTRNSNSTIQASISIVVVLLTLYILVKPINLAISRILSVYRSGI